MTTPYSASATAADAAPNRAAHLAGPAWRSRAEHKAKSPASKIAVAANWPTWTAVHIPLLAYAAKMAGWLLASPPACSCVMTMYRSCPTSSKVADMRTDVRSGAVLFMTILLGRVAPGVDGGGAIERVGGQSVRRRRPPRWRRWSPERDRGRRRRTC